MYMASNLMHMHIMQLMISLESDAVIGTLGSNWNRLIAELRCVWLPKCSTPYVEVGPRQDWKDYNWRRRLAPGANGEEGAAAAVVSGDVDVVDVDRGSQPAAAR